MSLVGKSTLTANQLNEIRKACDRAAAESGAGRPYMVVIRMTPPGILQTFVASPPAVYRERPGKKSAPNPSPS